MHQPKLNWVSEPALAPVGDDEMIYDQIISKRPDYFVAIYEGAEPDPELSAKDGRTRYRNVPMVCVMIKGEKDYISEALTQAHRTRFPRAVRAWETQRAAKPKTDTALLPGITTADLCELEELKLFHLDALIAAEVPENLRPWQDMAKRFASLSKPRMRLIDGQLQEAV